MKGDNLSLLPTLQFDAKPFQGIPVLFQFTSVGEYGVYMGVFVNLN